MPASTVRFLTPEWVSALDEAAGASTALAEAARGADLTVEQEVGDAGGEPVRYRMELRDGAVRFRWGPGEGADVTLVQSRATAEQLSRGELNAQRAIVAGKLRVRGDVGKLLAARDAFARLEDDVFAAVRERTAYG